ncbi:hypothetical protein ACFYWX_36515 [Streptomyces sp. NPDC002888]|uniref:hypothetical protein n=1 Tax=Streptomyces sp. NPDC002888 TaxID=3364668 RepID=UPI00369D9FBE
MTEVDLRAARTAHEAAVKREVQAFAELREASIRARRAIDEACERAGLPLRKLAQQMSMTPSALSKLNPQKDDGSWKPQGAIAYQAIDDFTANEFQLARLRRALDEARAQVRRAESDVSLAEARTDSERPGTTVDAPPAPPDGAEVVIDDVLVDQRHDSVVLDVRVRNSGVRAANITRTVVRIVERQRFLTAYAPSAQYDLLIDGDHNEGGVAHGLGPDEVDRFLLTLGFAEQEIGHMFTAELIVHFNRDRTSTSKRFTFDSCFE